jgi:hypothetical protein
MDTHFTAGVIIGGALVTMLVGFVGMFFTRK